MALSYITAMRNEMMDRWTANLGANARLRIYGGAVPANVAAALGGATLLVDLPCSATFAGAATGGQLTANAIAATNPTASGTATFFRVTTSGGTAIVQGTVGTALPADLILATTTITVGVNVNITLFRITEGNP